MIQPKKLSPKKMAAYSAIMAVMFGLTGYMLYSQYFKDTVMGDAGPAGMAINDGALDIMPSSQDINGGEEIVINKTEAAVKEGELDFLNSNKYLELRDNFEEIVVGEVGNNFPFSFKESDSDEQDADKEEEDDSEDDEDDSEESF